MPGRVLSSQLLVPASDNDVVMRCNHLIFSPFRTGRTRIEIVGFGENGAIFGANIGRVVPLVPAKPHIIFAEDWWSVLSPLAA